jgi:esterase
MGSASTTVAPAAVRDRYLTAGGLRFHLLEAGDPAAPAVLVLHEIIGHARKWDPLTATLADRFRVLAVGQRGHGETDWATEYTLSALAGDVAALIGTLDLTRPRLVGHSMGAMAAAQCAADHPELVGRLVLIDLPPDVPDTEFAARELPAALAVLAKATYATPDEAVAEWLAGNALANPVHLRHYVEHCLVPRFDQRLVWRFDADGLTDLISAQLWDALDRIAAPTLLIRGQHSPLLGASTAARMIHRLTDGELVEILHGGHDLGVEQPEAVAVSVRTFLPLSS